jgi:hypothetical protein
MSTIEDQQKEQDYSEDSNFFTENYLYFLFFFVIFAALLSGILILAVYKSSKREKYKMVKR